MFNWRQYANRMRNECLLIVFSIFYFICHAIHARIRHTQQWTFQVVRKHCFSKEGNYRIVRKTASIRYISVTIRQKIKKNLFTVYTQRWDSLLFCNRHLLCLHTRFCQSDDIRWRRSPNACYRHRRKGENWTLTMNTFNRFIG